jgi:hypothetical protein
MKPTLIEWPGKVVQVIEKEHGVSRSRFMSMRPNAYVFDCETDDSECCTKALRLVSGSDSAIHPRDWSNDSQLDEHSLCFDCNECGARSTI